MEERSGPLPVLLFSPTAPEAVSTTAAPRDAVTASSARLIPAARRTTETPGGCGHRRAPDEHRSQPFHERQWRSRPMANTHSSRPLFYPSGAPPPSLRCGVADRRSGLHTGTWSPGRPHGGPPPPQRPPHTFSRGAPPPPSLRCGGGRPLPGPPHRNLVPRGTRPRWPYGGPPCPRRPPLSLLLRGGAEPLLKKPATAAGVKQAVTTGGLGKAGSALLGSIPNSLSARPSSLFDRLVQQRQQAVG
jgi:hypothetical protein